jgi:hypothetical protein
MAVTTIITTYLPQNLRQKSCTNRSKMPARHHFRGGFWREKHRFLIDKNTVFLFNTFYFTLIINLLLILSTMH